MRAKRITVYGNILNSQACDDGLIQVLGMSKRQLENKKFRCSIEVLKKKLMKDMNSVCQFTDNITSGFYDEKCFLYGAKDADHISSIISDYEDTLYDARQRYNDGQWNTLSTLYEEYIVKAKNIEEEILDFLFNRVNWKYINDHLEELE